MPHEPREPAQGRSDFPRQRPAWPPSPRASRQGRMGHLAAGQPPWALMTVTSMRAPSAPLYRRSLKRPRSDLAAARPQRLAQHAPPPPCGSPCTGRLAVGPPRPRPPPEPPMTPITALNPKAHPLLPPQHPLPQCPFPLDLRGLFSALPTTTNSLQEGPRPGSTVREGDLGIVCFHRWHLPSGHGQIASSSCKPLAALDGRWGPGLPITVQPDG